MSDKVYVITKKSSVCNGQGDYGTETQLATIGGWGTGGFHPAFLTRKAAEDYIARPEFRYDSLKIVELRVGE